MIFQDLLAQVQALKFEELRAHTEDYFEAVISKTGLDRLHKVLASYFGPPLKPEGCPPSGEATRRAKPYGGIRRDQTMYFRQGGDHAECVLLWPWGGGARITVKIIRSQSPGPDAGPLGFLTELFHRKQ